MATDPNGEAAKMIVVGAISKSSPEAAAAQGATAETGIAGDRNMARVPESMPGIQPKP
jgi:hypothetical protein